MYSAGDMPNLVMDILLGQAKIAFVVMNDLCDGELFE